MELGPCRIERSRSPIIASAHACFSHRTWPDARDREQCSRWTDKKMKGMKESRTHNLQLHSLALQLNCSNLEVDSDCAYVALRVGVVGETQKQTRLGRRKSNESQCLKGKKDQPVARRWTTRTTAWPWHYHIPCRHRSHR